MDVWNQEHNGKIQPPFHNLVDFTPCCIPSSVDTSLYLSMKERDKGLTMLRRVCGPKSTTSSSTYFVTMGYNQRVQLILNNQSHNTSIQIKNEVRQTWVEWSQIQSEESEFNFEIDGEEEVEGKIIEPSSRFKFMICNCGPAPESNNKRSFEGCQCHIDFDVCLTDAMSTKICHIRSSCLHASLNTFKISQVHPGWNVVRSGGTSSKRGGGSGAVEVMLQPR
jgi:hypothetical protein